MQLENPLNTPQFPNSRDAQNPHRQIIGTASDQTHTVRVAFDVAATDRFEQ